MIVTKEEVKRIARIATPEYDDLIQTYIPIVQAELCDYLEDHFADPLIYYDSGQFSFVAGVPDTITDELEQFVLKRFAAGMDIYVEGGSNEGLYEIAAVTDSTLTLTSSGELITMGYNDATYKPGQSAISRVRWPSPLKIVAARMVQYLIYRDKPGGELSENKDGVVVTYDRRFAYPREITEMADKYRRPTFV
jgi:hypothetical protein